jgi:uncharacterized protein with NRDE domain
MCLIVFSFRQHAEYPLLLAGNRDEFYARPTALLDWWQDNNSILAGRDLAAGGTWLGINRRGQFAAVTNYREPGQEQKSKKSRGLLVQNFLETGEAVDYAKTLSETGGDYNGFNLLFGDANQVYYFSNRSGKDPAALAPGLYGLSNHLLDTPWPKVVKAKNEFSRIEPSDGEALLTLLGDRIPAEIGEVQQTGLPPETERALSPMFIQIARTGMRPDGDDGYGTRVSSLLRMDNAGNATLTERAYTRGEFAGDTARSFTIEK